MSGTTHKESVTRHKESCTTHLDLVILNIGRSSTTHKDLLLDTRKCVLHRGTPLLDKDSVLRGAKVS